MCAFDAVWTLEVQTALGNFTLIASSSGPLNQIMDSATHIVVKDGIALVMDESKCTKRNAFFSNTKYFDSFESLTNCQKNCVFISLAVL